MQSKEIQYKVIHANDDALHDIDFEGINYYRPKGFSIYRHNEDDFEKIKKTNRFILATIANTNPDKWEKELAIGCIELTYDIGIKMVAMPYIEVHSEYRQQGISKVLTNLLLAELMNDELYRLHGLYRTEPSLNCPKPFTIWMDKFLTEHNVHWYRHDSESSSIY